MALVTDYTSRVTSEHQSDARFMAEVAAVLQPFADMLNAVVAFPADYDLDEAVGTQLDAVGLWVGASRYVAIAVNQYFSFDTPGVGFDQGIWYQLGDSLSTVTALTDDQFRLLIRAKIACNSWDGSLPAAYRILMLLVGPDGCDVEVVEGNRSVAWTINGNISVVTQALLLGGYVPLKPIGIGVSYSFTAYAVDEDSSGNPITDSGGGQVEV